MTGTARPGVMAGGGELCKQGVMATHRPDQPSAASAMISWLIAVDEQSLADTLACAPAGQFGGRWLS
jgi:hypothetical protein